MDFDLIQFFIAMIVTLLWFSAAVGIVYDFIRYISRATGLNTIWRRLFESIILLTTGVFSWVWMEEPGTMGRIYGLVGHIIIPLSLIAFIYSTYRRGIISLWVDIAVNCCLLTGVAFLFIYSVCSNNLGAWLFMGLPVNILFIHILLVNYNQLRARYPPIPRH